MTHAFGRLLCPFTLTPGLLNPVSSALVQVEETGMNWEIIGAVGELAGTVAVVVSLIYLGRQIGLAAQQNQAAARYSFLSTYSQLNMTIAQNEQSASILRRGMDGETLNPDEHMQFTVQVGSFLNTWTVMFDLYNEKQLPENQWQLVESDIHSVFVTPGGRTFWDDIGRVNAHSEFVAFVDELLASKRQAYQLSSTGAHAPSH